MHGTNNSTSPTLLSLVSKWAVSHSLILQDHNDGYQQQSTLELLPMRVTEQILSLQSAYSLERYHLTLSTRNKNTNNRKLLQTVIDKCFKRLVDVQFLEPLIYSKLQTKQGQLLKEYQTEEECDYISMYFENYLQKCLVNVLSERQISEFVLQNDGLGYDVKEQKVVDPCKQFLDLPISDYVLNLAFTELDENNEMFHLSKQSFNTIGDCISRYAKHLKKISIPKTLLKYLDESCLIEDFFKHFTHINEAAFRDMRDSDVDHIIYILKQCDNVNSLSFYHSFFTETSIASILDIYSNCIYIPPVDYSSYFSDEIMKKKELEPQAMLDDEFDFYSDVLSPPVQTKSTLSDASSADLSVKKRENDNLFIDEIDAKKRKTEPPKLKKMSFRSISLYQSSCKAIREILEYNSIDSSTKGVELNFSFNEMTSPMANEMLSGDAIQHITKLILTENNVENDFLIHLSSQKQFFKNIKYLDLSNNNFVGTIGVNALFTALNSNVGIGLEHLNISHNKFGGTDLLNDNYQFVHQNELGKLIEYMTGTNCTKLKEILVSNCDLTAPMVESLLLSVANNSSLTTLDISNNHSLRLCGTSLSLMLASNTTLRKISMSTCSLHEISDSLFHSLLSNTTLQYVDLSGNRFKDHGGKNILNYLRNKLEQHQKQSLHMNTLDLSSSTLTEQFCLQLTQLFSYFSHNSDNRKLYDKHHTSLVPLIDILLLENNFFSPHLTLRLKQAALDSQLINKIVLTNEDGSSEVFSNVCDGTTLT